MAYVQVPKDLTKVKTKVMLNLTKRQLICFGLGGVTAVPVYFLSRSLLGNTMAAMAMILIAMPFFMFAIYEKDGRPLEKILMNMIQVKFKRPGIRPYQTENFYAAIQKEINEKEVSGIGKENKGASQRHKKRAGKNKG